MNAAGLLRTRTLGIRFLLATKKVAARYQLDALARSGERCRQAVSVAVQDGGSSPYVSRQMLRIDSADDRAADGVAKQQLEAAAHRSLHLA